MTYSLLFTVTLSGDPGLEWKRLVLYAATKENLGQRGSMEGTKRTAFVESNGQPANERNGT